MYLQPLHLYSKPKRKRVVKPSASTTGHRRPLRNVGGVTMAVSLVLLLTTIPAKSQELPGYILTWLGGDQDRSQVFDVNRDGVAVGQIRPGGSFVGRYGTISSHGRPEVNLDTLAAAHIPPGWMLTYGTVITDELLIGGQLCDTDGFFRCFAAQLSDDGQQYHIDWFKIFPNPPLGIDAYLWDASEEGLFLLDVAFLGGRVPYLWRPADDWVSAVDIDFELGETPLRRINNQGQTAFFHSYSQTNIWTSFRADLFTGSVISLNNDPNLETFVMDIGEDGSVIGSMQGAWDAERVPARWTAIGDWQPLSPESGSGIASRINAAGQICGENRHDDRLFLFSDALGFHAVDDLLVPGQDTDAWNEPGRYDERAVTISEVNGAGFAAIAGHKAFFFEPKIRGFILTPKQTNTTPKTQPLVISEVSIVSTTVFSRTVRVAWKSEIAESYRLLVSRDMTSWTPSGHGNIFSGGFNTDVEIGLPLDWENAYFKVEKLPASAGM